MKKYIIISLVLSMPALANSVTNSRTERIRRLTNKVKEQSQNIDKSALKTFTTDGCSMYPDRNYIPRQSHIWIHCCIAHDISYWVGGTVEQRLQADLELKSCVTDETNKQHGSMMYLGVRMGGVPGTGLPWAWGYGWHDYNDYQELSVSEIDKILKKSTEIIDIINYLPSDLVSKGLSSIQINYIQSVLESKEEELLDLKELHGKSK